MDKRDFSSCFCTLCKGLLLLFVCKKFGVAE